MRLNYRSDYSGNYTSEMLGAANCENAGVESWVSKHLGQSPGFRQQGSRVLASIRQFQTSLLTMVLFKSYEN
jgi:hypothetical protein